MPKTQPLEYQPATPAFLQRLKAGHAALDGRHNVQIPRARGNIGGVNDRLNMRGEEGEDEPIVVDESGNVVGREEVEGRLKRGKEEGVRSVVEVEEGGKAEDELQARGIDEEGKVASGFGRKRKVVKVVGEGGADGGEDVEDEKIKSLQESTKDLKSVVTKGKEDAKKEEAGKKTKRKKIKLSFDDPE